jgi:hypothetical protein
VDVPVPPVPHTVTPRSAAAGDIDGGVAHARGDQQPQPRQLAEPVRVEGRASRIATTTSYGSRALTSASVREMCSANTSIWPSERTADQSALARETC